MAIRKVIQIGHPTLHKHSNPIENISDEIHILAKDLGDTMRDMRLTGLAAPQLDEKISMFVTQIYPNKHRPDSIPDEFRVYINPKVVDISDEESEIFEGCGSVNSANLFGPVIRPRVVTVEATDLEGNTFKLRADGLLGRVILHEYDHLIGELFTEKVSDYRMLKDLDSYRKFLREYSTQKANTTVTIKELL